jgi:hypothetical protein
MKPASIEQPFKPVFQPGHYQISACWLQRTGFHSVKLLIQANFQVRGERHRAVPEENGRLCNGLFPSDEQSRCWWSPTFRQASDLLQGNILIQMGKYFSDHDRVYIQHFIVKVETLNGTKAYTFCESAAITITGDNSCHLPLLVKPI